MSIEWSDPYNSFNSLKGLLYKPWMDGILEGRYLPPLEASIDPVYTCNIDCVWCNSLGILKNPERKGHRMTTEHMVRLCAFLVDWGVRGYCFAGGGEPLLHEGCAEVVEYLGSRNRESAFLTNGILLGPRLNQALVQYGRWIGISIDSADRDNYARVKGCPPELYDRAVENTRQLAALKRARGSRLEVTFKFLLYPENAPLIYQACLLARDLGCDAFHCRPAASEHVLGDATAVLKYDVRAVNEAMERCHELESPDFKVFTVRHKFSRSFTLENRFRRCQAAPLLIQLGPDGNVYHCVDHRGKSRFILGTHWPDPEAILDFWGSERHQRFMASIDVSKCPRCTFGIYNEIMENAIEEDRMCMNFP